MANYCIDYPEEYEKQLKPLLHQQMWLFGRDILYPEENLLYRYQFTRNAAQTNGGSMYTQSKGDRQIVLWGWGIWFGREDIGSIFVNRYKAKPQFTSISSLNQPIYQPKDLPCLAHQANTETEAQTIRSLWCDLLLWLANYEAWILETAGDTWRQEALKQFNKSVTTPEMVSQLPGQWQTLAEQSQQLPIKSQQIERDKIV